MKNVWVAVLFGVVGCGDSTDGASTVPADLEIASSYALTSRVDVSAEALLPEPAANYLETLRLLHDDPGAAFFVLLDEAGVPLVDELRAALPDAVEGKLEDWIADAMPDTFKAKIGVILALADQALVSFDLQSTLELPPHDVRGRARATHTLTGVRFGQLSFAVPQVATVTSTMVDVTLSHSEAGAAAHLELASHQFGLDYGERIFALLDRGPGGLRAELGSIANCPAMAAEVADQCLLSVCVGHETQLAMLCERGLDEVVKAVHAKLATLRFDLVQLEHGTCEMIDADGNRSVEGLEGSWTAKVNLGQGLRPVTSSFTATRG